MMHIEPPSHEGEQQQFRTRRFAAPRRFCRERPMWPGMQRSEMDERHELRQGADAE